MANPATDGERRLGAYMAGWRKGARGASMGPGEFADLDVRAGWKEGFRSARQAYRIASIRYDARLPSARGAAVEPARSVE